MPTSNHRMSWGRDFYDIVLMALENFSSVFFTSPCSIFETFSERNWRRTKHRAAGYLCPRGGATIQVKLSHDHIAEVQGHARPRATELTYLPLYLFTAVNIVNYWPTQVDLQHNVIVCRGRQK